MKKLTNKQLAEQFYEMSEIINKNLQSPKDRFKAAAYETVAMILEKISQDLSQLTAEEISKIDGIGKSSAEKIEEAFKSGNVISKLKELRIQYSDKSHKRMIEKLNPVFAVLKCNKAKDTKFTIENDTVKISTKIIQKNLHRLFNMLNGISFELETRTHRTCQKVLFSLTIN